MFLAVVEGAARRAEIADFSDPSKTLSRIGTSLGLEGTEIQKLRSDTALAKMSSTPEGRAWSREITESAKTINAAVQEGGDKSAVYSAISDVVNSSGDEKKEAEGRLRKLTNRTDIQDLVSSGQMLQHTGLLDDMAGGTVGEDLTRAIIEALKNLQKSERVVADVKPQHLTIDGRIAVTGDGGVLDADGYISPA